MSISSLLTELERLIRTDPARRGLIATEAEFGQLLEGQLALAAEDLASHATSVAIVTGFFIPSALPPAAETDGPIGAALLGTTLQQLGATVWLVTDAACESVLRVAAAQYGLPGDCVYAVQSSQAPQSGCFDFVPFEELSHLISIERVGPSHTLESLMASGFADAESMARFQDEVSAEAQGHCFNMRGLCIDEWTAPLHQLFDQAKESGRITTIGIGDGGNEIGMGSVPWAELSRRLPDPQSCKIICRVPCDHTILAGVSNWGGYALAAAVALLRNRLDILLPWTSAQQLACLEHLVKDGPAVDGVTRLAQPTVDGLPFATYIQPWDAIRQLLGLPR